MTTPMRNWWHELNTWEPDVALAFYARTLGWQFDPAPLPDGSNYWIAHSEGNAMGGVFALTAPRYSGIPSHWMTYMAVGDIDQAERDAAKAGGEIMRPAARVPGVGKLVVVSDSAGALIGLIEPEAGHALVASQH
jgi:predicted enzyme related to lactoylglutathione lyase